MMPMYHIPRPEHCSFPAVMTVKMNNLFIETQSIDIEVYKLPTLAKQKRVTR